MSISANNQLDRQSFLQIPVDASVVSGLITGIMGLIALSALVWWSLLPPPQLHERIPGMDRTGSLPSLTDKGPKEQPVLIGEHLEKFAGVPAEITGSWPRFRGETFDNISYEKVAMAEKWGKKGPKRLWTVELGEGHAAPTIFQGRVYLLDYDEQRKADALRCFSLADGREIWRRWYRVPLKRNHGFSRTIPAVNENYVVTIGPKCHVMCVDRVSGALRWGLDLVKDFGAEVPFWYTGQCPLIDNGLAVLAPAGKDTLLMAVDCASGKIIWRTPNPHGWKMSHSSIMPMTFAGKKMLIYCAVGGVIGVAADGQQPGKILWQTTLWAPSVIAPSPLALPDGRIFMTAGYGAGSMMLQLSEHNGQYTVICQQQLKPHQGLASEQQTPLYYQGHLLGILPKDAGARRNQLVCCLPGDCSKMVWTSGKTDRFGLGPYIIADARLFVLNDDGVLSMFQVSTPGYVLLDRAKIFDGHDAWGPIAIAGGRMLIRDDRRMVCIDLRKLSD